MEKQTQEQEKKNVRKELIEKMIFAKEGTDITSDVRSFHIALLNHETELRNNFSENVKKGPLSEADLDKIRNRVNDHWINHYRDQTLTCEDLPMIPVLYGINQKKLAKRMLDEFVKSPNYDKKNCVLRHSRNFEGVPCGNHFVDLRDNLNFAYALKSLGKQEAASEVITFIRNNLVSLKFLKEQQSFGTELKKGEEFRARKRIVEVVDDYKRKGFNVDISKQVSQGYLSCQVSAKHPQKLSDLEVLDYIPVIDSWARDKRQSKFAGFLFGEVFCGNKGLASKVFTSLGTNHCTGTYSHMPEHFEPEITTDAAKFLILSKLIGDGNCSATQLSQKSLDKAFVPEWGLYNNRRLYSKDKPEMKELNAYTQLYVALLRLYEDRFEDARALVSNAVHAGLFEKGKFIDPEICSNEIHKSTNSIGIRVLEALHDSKQLEKILFF